MSLKIQYNFKLTDRFLKSLFEIYMTNSFNYKNKNQTLVLDNTCFSNLNHGFINGTHERYLLNQQE